MFFNSSFGKLNNHRLHWHPANQGLRSENPQLWNTGAQAPNRTAAGAGYSVGYRSVLEFLVPFVSRQKTLGHSAISMVYASVI
jgi:hypothetical protein